MSEARFLWAVTADHQDYDFLVGAVVAAHTQEEAIAYVEQQGRYLLESHADKCDKDLSGAEIWPTIRPGLSAARIGVADALCPTLVLVSNLHG